MSKLLFLLDTAKAFDTIDHDWVTHVLSKAGFPLWLRSFVEEAFSCVKVSPFFGGPLSVWIDILRGVKQGCPLSPLLFVIAYDPLLDRLAGLGSFVPFAFADDLALFADSVSAISPALVVIDEFSRVSGLGVNKDKSVAIPTAGEESWLSISNELLASPWPDLPLRASGTHLGILIGREVTLGMLWKGPIEKASERLKKDGALPHLPDAVHERFHCVTFFLHRPFFCPPPRALVSGQGPH